MAYVETFPPYKVVLEFKPSFLTSYMKISEYNRTYEEKLIKIYARSEPIRVTQFEFNGALYSKELNSYTKKIEKTGSSNEYVTITIEEDDYNAAIEAFRTSELEKLHAERTAILDILYASGINYRYQLPTLYKEIMNQMNTYALKHKRSYNFDSEGNYNHTDYFYFDDTIVPMNIFAFLRKEYPYFMECIQTFVLKNNENELIDFMDVNV